MLGDFLVVRNSALMREFGFAAAQASHQFGVDGDRFNSPDNAALAWGLTFWAEANRTGEFASNIYRATRGRYFVEAGVSGTANVPFVTDGIRNRVTPAPIDLNWEFELAATIHTHPMALRANNFSQPDLRDAHFVSYLISRDRDGPVKIPAYIVTNTQVRSTEAVRHPNPTRHRQFATYNERTVFSGLRH